MKNVLTNRGVKSVAEIPEHDLFATMHQTRAAMGLPSAYMLAQAAADRGEQLNVEDFADEALPSTRAKINAMAVGFYDKADKLEDVDDDVELKSASGCRRRSEQDSTRRRSIANITIRRSGKRQSSEQEDSQTQK